MSAHVDPLIAGAEPPEISAPTGCPHLRDAVFVLEAVVQGTRIDQPRRYRERREEEGSVAICLRNNRYEPRRSSRVLVAEPSGAQASRVCRSSETGARYRGPHLNVDMERPSAVTAR